jgi:glycosyltransferase involved in cell wall biosynthesis
VKVVMLLGRSTGGIGTHVEQLCADLRECGVDVIVVTHRLTARHFDLGPARLWWPGSDGWVNTPRSMWKLRALAASSDIVHAHGQQAGLLATLATLRLPARAGGPKLVVSQHNAILRGASQPMLKRVAQRWVARHADLMTGASIDLVDEARALGAERAELAEVPSPRVPDLLARQPADGPSRARARKALFASLAGEHDEKCNHDDRIDDLAVPAGPGVPANPVVPANSVVPADSDRPLVVTISRIAPQKNLSMLVEAAARLRHSYTWVVVGGGDPELLERLQAQARALGATVHFVGTRGDADQWLRAAEVFVLPSHWEARALVVQEAMAAGTPVVATDVGGLRDLVAGAGLLVRPGDPQAIATATDSVLADQRLRDDLSARGREVANALPDGRDTASRWLKRYGEAMR